MCSMTDMHVLHSLSNKEFPGSKLWHSGFASGYCCFRNSNQDEGKNDTKMKSQKVIPEVTIRVLLNLHQTRNKKLSVSAEAPKN